MSIKCNIRIFISININCHLNDYYGGHILKSEGQITQIRRVYFLQFTDLGKISISRI